MNDIRAIESNIRTVRVGRQACSRGPVVRGPRKIFIVRSGFPSLRMEKFKKYFPTEVNTVNWTFNLRMPWPGKPGMPYPEDYKVFDHRQPETYLLLFSWCFRSNNFIVFLHLMLQSQGRLNFFYYFMTAKILIWLEYP